MAPQAVGVSEGSGRSVAAEVRMGTVAVEGGGMYAKEQVGEGGGEVGGGGRVEGGRMASVRVRMKTGEWKGLKGGGGGGRECESAYRRQKGKRFGACTFCS